MKKPLLTYKVKLLVTGLPESAGLRIRSTDPTGLYVSSRDPAAAQWYFEGTIISAGI